MTQHLKEALRIHLLLLLISWSLWNRNLLTLIQTFKSYSLMVYQWSQFGLRRLLRSLGRALATGVGKIVWDGLVEPGPWLSGVCLCVPNHRHALLLDTFKDRWTLLCLLRVSRVSGALSKDSACVSYLLNCLTGPSWWRITQDFSCLLLNVDVEVLGQLVEELLILLFLRPSNCIRDFSCREAFALGISCWNGVGLSFTLGGWRFH